MDPTRRNMMKAALPAAAAMPLVPLMISDAEAATQAFPTYAFPGTGMSASRTTPDRVQDFVSVKEFGAIGNGVANDTAAFQAMITYLISSAGLHLTGYIPAGRYVITAPMPTITAPIGLYGAGPYKTWIVCPASFIGDLFSISQCWVGTPSTTGTVNFTQLQAGVVFQGFSITGNLTSTGTQNAFVFYNINDFVRMTDIDVWYMNGRGLYSGAVTGSNTVGCLRESVFNKLRFWRCGKVGFPVVEFTSTGSATTSDATNEIDINMMGIYAPRSTGFIIQNKNQVKPINLIRVHGLRIEGEADVVVAADSLVIGDTVNNGDIVSVMFTECNLINTYNGQAAIRVTGSGTAADAPSWIYFQGQIWNSDSNGTGDGLVIVAGRFLTFDLTRNAAVSPGQALIVSASTLLSGPIIINAYGRESTWVGTDIDSTSLGIVRFTPYALDFHTGSGSPSGVVEAGVGALYVDTTGKTWVKTSAATASTVWTQT